MDSTNIFISYRHQDRDFTQKLVSDLTKANFSLWIDYSNLNVGDNWVLNLQAGIEEAIAYIVILSPGYIESIFCMGELQRIAFSSSNGNKPIFVLLIEDVEEAKYPYEIQRLQYLDLKDWKNNKSYKEKLEYLIGELRKIPNIVLTPTPPLSNVKEGTFEFKSLEDELTNLKKKVDDVEPLQKFQLIKKKILQERLDLLIAQWEKANQQLNTVGQLAGHLYPVIQAIIQDIEEQIKEVNQEINSL